MATDSELRRLMAQTRLMQLQDKRRKEAIESELNLSKEKTAREKQVLDLFPTLLNQGGKVANDLYGQYQKAEDKSKAETIEEASVLPTTEKRKLEAIGESIPELEIEVPLTAEERADKLISQKKSEYRKNPWSSDTLNETSLKKIRPKLIASIRAKDEELAKKQLESEKAVAEIAKTKTEAQKVKADTSKVQAETEGKLEENKHIAPKAEADLYAKIAGADKDYSDIQKTKIETISKSVDKFEIKKALALKDPAAQAKALEDLSEGLAESTGENQKLVRGVIGSAAFAIADDQQKEALKASQWAKEQGFKWASLAETRKDRELRAKEREDVRADKKAISTDEREMLYQRKSALEDAKGLQDLVKKAGPESVVGVGNALASGIKNSLKNPAISVEEGIGAAMNEMGRDDVGKAIMRKTLQLVQRVGKSREGGRMTDADLRFYLQNLINTGTSSPQDFSNSIDELLTDTKKGYSLQRNSLIAAGKTAMDEFPEIDIETSRPSYEVQIEQRKEATKKETEALGQRNEAIAGLDPVNGSRLYELVEKHVGEDPAEQTKVLKALANAQAQGKGTEAKFLLESGNIKELERLYGPDAVIAPPAGEQEEEAVGGALETFIRAKRKDNRGHRRVE